MSVASSRRRGRRGSYIPARMQREAEAPPEEQAPGTAVSTVETVETVPSVTEKPTGKPSAPSAPMTVSRRRRRGITTPARRATRLEQEAAQVATLPYLPYGDFTPFVTEEGTVDVTKMVEEKGSGETAKMLTDAGYTVTPKVVEVIATGKDVSGMTTTDRAILANLAGLTGAAAVTYITGGNLGKRDVALKEIPPSLKQWYSDNLSGVTASSMASYLWPAAPTVSRPGGKQRRYGGQRSEEVLAQAQYLKEAGFSSAELATFVRDSEARWSEGELGYVLSKIAGKTAPEGIDAAWYNQQLAEMDKELADAKKQVQKNIAKLKASGKDYERSDIIRIYKNAYPKWSDQYQRKAKELPRKLAYEAKTAAYKARQAMLETVEVSEISIPATEQELAQAATERASGQSCPATVNTYKVKLKDGSVVLVQALQHTSNLEQGRDDAITKAEAADYNVAWATKRIGDETVTYKKMPTIDVGLFEVKNAEGKVIKIHASLEAPDSTILEMADAYGLRGKPDQFTITERGRESITGQKASELLTNAEMTSNRAYGLMYMTVSPAFGGDFAVSPDSVPVRIGKSNTAVTFLSSDEAGVFRLTETYNKTKGTDLQRLNAAYQEYLSVPGVDMPGGWQMLKNSIRDAVGNILIYGFDALSEDRQEEIEAELEAGTMEKIPEPEEEETELAEETVEEEGEEEKISGMEPELATEAGVAIPISQEELNRVAEAKAKGQCVGAIRAYYTPKIFKVRLRDGSTILVEALTDDYAEKKATAEGYDVTRVSRMFSWESPEAVASDRGDEDTEDTGATESVFSTIEFEVGLGSKPQFLQNAYATGGISGYNAAVEVYNDTLRSANRVYGEDSTAYMDPQFLQAMREAYDIGGHSGYMAAYDRWMASHPGESGKKPNLSALLTAPALVARVNSPEFQQQYAAVLQPANMSDEEYAVIAPYITPKGIDVVVAFKDEVPGEAFIPFAYENSSDEFKAKVDSGELIMLPYGGAIDRETFEYLADIHQETLRTGGFPLLKQQEEENWATNLAQGFRQNSIDALHLASVNVKHDIGSFGVAQLREAIKTDYKAGDLDPTDPRLLALYSQGGEMAGLTELVWNLTGKGDRLTATEAEALNARNEDIITHLEHMYDSLQRSQLNWRAEHPLLEPIYPEGALEALGNLKSAKDIPLILSETIMSTLPYTLATMGVSTLGWMAGGPAGVTMVAPIVFGFTLGVEGHQIYADALANGATRERAAELMYTYGSISAAVETVGDSLLASFLGGGARLLANRIGRKFAAEVVTEAAKKYGWANLTNDVVKQFLNQATQEFLQQLVHNAAIKTVNENQALTEGVWDAFVAGLIGTAPFILIPAGGQAIRIGRGTTATDIEGKIQNAKFRPSDQKTVVSRVLQPLAQLMDAIGNTPVARKVATLYIRVGQLAMNYAANSAELAHVRDTLRAFGEAKQLVDQEAIDALKARERELVKEMGTERNDLQSVSKELVELLSGLPSVDKEALQRIQDVPSNAAGYIDELVEQIMQGRKRATLTGELTLGEQRVHTVSTFAKTAADAKAAADAIRGIPKGTKLSLQIAVNDMLYALGRLGDAVVAAPGMARDAVVKAADDLQLKVKKVYDLLRNLPEQSKVKLLQTVNAVSDFAASAKFVATSSAKIAISEVDYAVTRLGDTIRATPDVTAKAVTKAITAVDVAVKKAEDTIGEIPDTVSRGLSKALLDVTMTARDAKIHVDMRGRIALNELIYAANRLATAVNESVEAVWLAVYEFNMKLHQAMAVARQLPETARNELITTVRRLEANVKQLVNEKAIATRMTAKIVANDVEYAAQTLAQAVKDAPQNVVSAAIQTRNTVRTSLRSNRLLFIMSVKTAYNELDYAVNHLVDIAKATLGIINAEVQAALKTVLDKINKVNAAVEALASRTAAVPGKVVTAVREDISTLTTLVADVKSLAIGDLSYYIDQLVDTIRSVPRATNDAILTAAAAVNKAAYKTKRQVQQLPEQARKAALRYVNSALALANAARATVKSGADLSMLGAKVALGELEYQIAQVKDNIQSAPGRAKVAVADAVTISRVQLKQLPMSIELGIENYVSDLRRGIRLAEENRLNRAYFKVGEDVRSAVESEFGSIIAGRKKLVGEKYSAVLNGLTDILTALLRVVQGADFSQEVHEAVNKATEAVFSGDEARVATAGATLEDLLNTVPGLSKDRKRVSPKVRTARQLILDGGSYIRTKAADLVKAIQYKVIVEDLQNAETWSDAKVKLENYRDLLKGEQVRIQEEQTLSDMLSQVNWEKEAGFEGRQPPPSPPSLREQMRQTMIQDRIRKMMETCLYKDFLYRDMQSSSKKVRQAALENMQGWLEDRYGKDYMDEIVNEVEEQLASMGIAEGEEPTAVAEEARPAAEAELNVEEALNEVERILKDNENRPPDTPPPDGVREMKPPERPPGGGPRVATAVKEKVEIEVETAEELTAEEREALEEAKKEKTLEEMTEEERKALEDAKKAREAEEAAQRRVEERISRRVRPGPVPGEVTRVIGKTMPAEALPAEKVEEMPAIKPAEMPAIEPAIEPAVETSVQQAIQEQVKLNPIIQEQLSVQQQQQLVTQLQQQLALQVQQQPMTQEQLATAVQQQLQTQLQMQPALGVAVQPAVKVPWWMLPPAQALKEAYRRRAPILIWKMGKLKSGDVWKAVIAPQKQVNLLTVIGTANLPVPPKRYATGPGSAQKTLQWLGKGPRHKGAADIGVVDVFWDRSGKNLRFGGKGLKTDVGTRLATPTKGISIEVPLTPVKATKVRKKAGALPKRRIVAASPAGVVVPLGSLVWAAGTIGRGVSRVQTVRWYYLPPPYTGGAIPIQGPPRGAKNPKGTRPLDTVQIVGRPRKAVPAVRVDLGFAEVLAANGKIDQVVPKEVRTVATATADTGIGRPSVPERESTTAEVAEQIKSAQEAQPLAEAETLELDEEELVLEPKPKTRVGLPTKVTRHKKPLTNYEYMTTLKGFDPYTSEGM